MKWLCVSAYILCALIVAIRVYQDAVPLEPIYRVGDQVFVTWKVANFCNNAGSVIPGVAGLAMRDCELVDDSDPDVVGGCGKGTPVCLLGSVLEPIIKLGGLVYIGDNHGA